MDLQQAKSQRRACREITVFCDLAKPIDAVAFIGHAISETEEPHAAWGIWFAHAKPLVKRRQEFYWYPAEARLVDRIDTRAKIVFVGACKVGDTFKSMWDINNATQSRALVYSPTDSARLGVLIQAWAVMLGELARGVNVQSAMDAANIAIRRWTADHVISTREDGKIEQFECTGDGNTLLINKRAATATACTATP